MHDALPRPPLLQRLPSGGWAALTWCVVAGFALVLYVAMLSEDADLHLDPVLAGVSVAMAAPLGWVRRWPSPVLAVMLAEVAVATVLGVPPEGIWPVLLAADVLVCVVTAARARRIGLVAAVLTVAVQQGAWQLHLWSSGHRALAPGFLALTILLALIVVVAWTAGTSIRQRREYGAALRAQAAVQAVTAERLRIARELHDMVAHSIGVIAIQAGAGGRVIDAEPGQAREALRAIEDTSRQTLKGLRRMLGVLRQPEPAAAEAPPAGLVGLADVDRLAATTARAGVGVEVRWRGERRPLPAAVDQSAFRIIQESVTNVVRHAGTGHCRVSIDVQGDEVRIEVVDDGRGVGGGVAGGGYGIAGMRERVALLNGDFSAGPRPGGGFRVAARLPVPAR